MLSVRPIAPVEALGLTLALASVFWSLADFTGLATEEAPAYSEELEKEFMDCLVKLAASAGDQRFEELAAKSKRDGLSEDEKREFAILSTGRGTPDADT